ncbi:MAG TPA: hypothetical protein ENN90_13825 [Mariniphaga anaerophila]|uniref:Pectate lyase superfamily protein n=1 Tax=Mariniphaga anaerophila TaxID=1484053 RepID=A0A831PRF1_9BACT|nr:hypothetical protein [Mariniphaga anaerophila]
MKNYTLLFFLVLLVTGFVFPVFAQNLWSPDHVYYGKGGNLNYTPDEKGNIIPDFSHVGYRYGDVPLPEIKTVLEVYPVDGDDGSVIQSAITSLYNIEPDENGFRGAVLLKAGVYQVSGQLKISANGIVLRGEGDSENGTVIIAEGKNKRDLIKIDNGKSRTVYSSTRVAITEDYIPVGRKFVIVSDPSNFTEGDNIVLYRPGTSAWISDIKMDQITPSEGTVQWSPSGYSFYFERLVTKVSGDTLFFRNPVVMAMETKYGGGYVYKFSFDRLQNIGIENMRLKSAYTSNQDEDHSWNAIAFYSAENCWVRNISSFHFSYSCVNLQSKSRLITVENCHYLEPKSILTGGRRYSFNITGSLHLVKNCSTSEGRHDYVTGARVCGPNVFSNCTATNTYSDIGPHHRWAMGTLFDKIESDGQINVQDRDDSGTGHGWAGANTVFWNCKGSSSICESPWNSAKNYNFGFIGKKERKNRPDGEWVGHNHPGIFPSSLYEAQLDERLNGTTLFSAISNLIQINDTAFLMQFSLPLVPEQITTNFFEVSGTISFEKDNFSVHQNDDYSVVVSSGKFRNLPDLSEIEVTAKELNSLDGKPLTGITTASFILSDKRPVVTGQAKITDNIEGYGEAASNKPGYIYLVKYGINATTVSELDSLINVNLGRKISVFTADTFYTLSTRGLPGGYYQYYAVDENNRVSLPSSTWIIVDELGPVTGLDSNVVSNNFKAILKHGILFVDPGNEAEYTLAIYNITGQLIFSKNHLFGMQTIHLKGNNSVFIIKKASQDRTETLKLTTHLFF